MSSTGVNRTFGKKPTPSSLEDGDKADKGRRGLCQELLWASVEAHFHCSFQTE